MDSPVLEAADIKFQLAGRICGPFSFRLRAGELAAVFSQRLNFSSAFLSLCMGREALLGGKISVSGCEVNSEEGRRRIGFAGAVPGFYPEMTVGEYLDFFAELYGIDTYFRPYIVNEALEITKIGDFRSCLIGRIELPYVLKRVSIARAYVHNPRLLIIEDALGVDDYQTAAETLKIIGNIRNTGKAVLVSSENLQHFADICSQVFLIGESEGIIYKGSFPDFTADLQSLHLIQIQAAESSFDDLLTALSENGRVKEILEKDDNSFVLRFIYKGRKDDFEAFIQKEAEKGLALVSCSYLDSFFGHRQSAAA